MNSNIIKWTKRIGIVLLLTTGVLYGYKSIKQKYSNITNTYFSTFSTYRGSYKTVNTKAFTINLPADAEVTYQNFDGVKYEIDAHGKCIYNIVAIPFKQNPEIAEGYLRTPNNDALNSFPNFKPIMEENIKGIYAKRNDGEEHLMDGETFCFIKDGFTFYVLSYGAVENYYSAIDVVKSIKPIVKPITDKEKDSTILQILPLYQEKCLEKIRTKIQQDMILHDNFQCTNVIFSKSGKIINIQCILKGDYSQLYPGQKSLLERVLSEESWIKPYSANIALLGYTISIGFYKLTGEKINLQ